jgi:hypothetical protein
MTIAGAEDDDLAALLRAGIIRELVRFPELQCTFRHGLLQEASLSTLTPAALRELYGSVGRAMEQHLAGRTEEALEQLAFYFYRSDDQARALDLLERAAARAAELEAEDHARELWVRATRVAERLGNEQASARIRSRLEGLDSGVGETST